MRINSFLIDNFFWTVIQMHFYHIDLEIFHYLIVLYDMTYRYGHNSCHIFQNTYCLQSSGFFLFSWDKMSLSNSQNRLLWRGMVSKNYNLSWWMSCDWNLTRHNFWVSSLYTTHDGSSELISHLFVTNQLKVFYDFFSPATQRSHCVHSSHWLCN